MILTYGHNRYRPLVGGSKEIECLVNVVGNESGHSSPVDFNINANALCLRIFVKEGSNPVLIRIITSLTKAAGHWPRLFFIPPFSPPHHKTTFMPPAALRGASGGQRAVPLGTPISLRECRRLPAPIIEPFYKHFFSIFIFSKILIQGEKHERIFT
jgi:hypothetical protein